MLREKIALTFYLFFFLTQISMEKIRRSEVGKAAVGCEKRKAIKSFLLIVFLLLVGY
jgi:hypothetical protein